MERTMKFTQFIVSFCIVISFFSYAWSQTAVERQRQEDALFQMTAAYDLLKPLLKLPEQVTVRQFSSHNKKGLNGDVNWALYKDTNGDDVIFDAAGPGRIKSMWGTSLDADAILKFYFDGEKAPRYEINYIEFYRGKNSLFPAPLNSYEKRGYWGDRPFAGNSFVPVPFEKSLKISVQGRCSFFHVIYEQYPYKTPVTSFTGNEDRAPLIDAFENPAGSPVEEMAVEIVTTETEIINQGQVITLLKKEAASGIVRHIVIEADGSPEFFRETHIRMRWDGRARWDIQAPTGIFFGSAVEANDMRSLPLRVEKLDDGRVRMSSSFPMPFWKQAEIQLVNRSTHRFAPMKASVYVSPNDIDPARGTYFAAMYRDGETTSNRDWLLFEGTGTGWYAGTVQSMHGSHYCEGDEHFYMDDVISPQINGTGSEDYYLACFWPNLDFDMPFGCVVGDVNKQGGGSQLGAYYVPSCYSRFHLEAPIPFYSSIDAKIQHGGLSDIFSHYRSLAFCYMRNRQSLFQTDYIDVGNTASEQAHGYKATKSGPVTGLKAHPEGELFESVVDGKGRYHTGGEIAFSVALDPENRGMRLRRRLDQGIAPQKADVYIDGEFAGCWYHGYHNEYLRWFDSDIDIHPDFTRGKSGVEVKLIVQEGAAESSFTDFAYTIYCFVD